ncbi:hypothetical protein HDU85_003925 [Gaertneriomyces sp. JEL0708]|nr:hypothetical protein HDU85_003925 [Gaertneriomyces sp. JEL0708]
MTEETIRTLHAHIKAADKDNANVIVLKVADARTQADELATPLKDETSTPIDRAKLKFPLDHLVATLDTPLVAIMDGPVGNDQLGLTVNAPIRIATENSVVSISPGVYGSLPDPGLSFFLARLPDGSRVGKYLALTGKKLRGMELVLSGFASHYIPADRLEALTERICSSKTSDLRALNLTIDEFAAAAPPKSMWNAWSLNESLRLPFERCFNHTSYQAIRKALETEKSEWATDSLDRMPNLDAVSGHLIVEAITRAKELDIASSYQMAYRITDGLSRHANKVLSSTALSDKDLRTFYFDVDETVHLALDNARTYTSYVHRTVTGLPSEEDVRKVVSGETSTSGAFAMTAEEILEWFADHWGSFMNNEILAPLTQIPENAGGARYMEYIKDPAETGRSRHRRKEIWAVRQRVEGILETRCERIGDGEKFLRWKR